MVHLFLGKGDLAGASVALQCNVPQSPYFLPLTHLAGLAALHALVEHLRDRNGQSLVNSGVFEFNFFNFDELRSIQGHRI